jgi:hypothetical protein
MHPSPSVPSLAAGASATYTIVVNVSREAPSTLTAVAGAFASLDPEPFSAVSFAVTKVGGVRS